MIDVVDASSSFTTTHFSFYDVDGGCAASVLSLFSPFCSWSLRQIMCVVAPTMNVMKYIATHNNNNNNNISLSLSHSFTQ